MTREQFNSLIPTFEQLAAITARSTDGIDNLQAKRFAEVFRLSNLRLENGIWVADDDYGEDSLYPYSITEANYWGAWHEGDLT